MPAALAIGWFHDLFAMRGGAVLFGLLWLSAFLGPFVGFLVIAFQRRKPGGLFDLLCVAAGFGIWLILLVPPVFGYLADVAHVARYRAEWMRLVETVRAPEVRRDHEVPRPRAETPEPIEWGSHLAFVRDGSTSVVFTRPLGFFPVQDTRFAWGTSQPRPLGPGDPPFRHLAGNWWTEAPR